MTFRSTGDDRQAGEFTIGKATIAGQPIPTVNPLAAFDLLNAALKPLGVQMVKPAVHQSSGILFVDPMGISVVPSATRDGLVAPGINAVDPAVRQLLNPVLQADCELGTEVTVLDAAIGDVDGSGFFDLELGGVQATSGTVPGNGFELGASAAPPLDSLPAAGSVPAANVAFSSSDGSGGAGSGVTSFGDSPASSPAGAVAASPRSGTPIVATLAPIRALRGKRGGALAVVSLSGLGLLAVLAEGDRRKMRRAQRQLSTFEE